MAKKLTAAPAPEVNSDYVRELELQAAKALVELDRCTDAVVSMTEAWGEARKISHRVRQLLPTLNRLYGPECAAMVRKALDGDDA